MSSDQTIARAFNALAHPRRVKLFRLLVEQPELGRSVGNLQEVSGIRKAPLLHHLRVMEAAGLIARRRTGSTVAQIVRPGPLAAAIEDVQRLSARLPRPPRAAA